MNKLIIHSLCFFWPFFCLAQKHDQNWVAGSSFTDTIYMINFSDTGLAYIPIVPPIEQVRGSFGISDKEGKLQFYTNGNYIVSWNHVIMENGDSLNLGAWTSQNNTFPDVKNSYMLYAYQVIPDGYDENVYYLIHSFMKLGKYPVDQVSTRLQITKIDMKENKGLGRVIYKNKTLYSHELACRFAVIRHGNGADWWILVRELNGKKYHNLHLKQDSLIALTIQESSEGSELDLDEIDSVYTCRLMCIASQNGQVLVDPIGSSLIDARATWSMSIHCFMNGILFLLLVVVAAPGVSTACVFHQMDNISMG